jgi:hypothetical protein
MKYQGYKSRCKNCNERAEYSHEIDGMCLLRDEFWYVAEHLRTYMPSDNLEYLEYLYDKFHSTI